MSQVCGPPPSAVRRTCSLACRPSVHRHTPARRLAHCDHRRSLACPVTSRSRCRTSCLLSPGVGRSQASRRPPQQTRCSRRSLAVCPTCRPRTVLAARRCCCRRRARTLYSSRSRYRCPSSSLPLLISISTNISACYSLTW